MLFVVVVCWSLVVLAVLAVCFTAGRADAQLPEQEHVETPEFTAQRVMRW